MAQTLSRSFADVGARRMGSKRGGIPQRYVLDEPGRQLLLARYDGRSETIDDLARRFGVPRWRIRRWAAELGLARQKEPRWTEDDLHYLEAHLARVGVRELARHLGRTETAVRLKAKRLGTAKGDDGYTMRGLCEGLGVDHHKAERWLAAGWLRGTRRQTERTPQQGGDMWLFTDAAIRALVKHHPGEVDPRRVDWIWLIDVLLGGDFGTGTHGGIP